MKYLCLIALLSLSVSSVWAQKKLVQLWETKDLPVPESVLFSPKTNLLYVSLIDGGGSDKDGKGGVALLNLDGSVKDKNWITGMDAPKGLAIYKDVLYVADITAVSIIDIISGNEIDRVEVPGAVFLNDVTIDDNGVVYVSDTRTNKIHVLRDNQPSVFMENVTNVNGLKFIGDYLYALAGPELWKIDRAKKVTVLAKGFELGGDGLEPVGKGDFLVTCWGGLIYYVHANGTFDLLLDVRGKMNTADLGFHPATNTVYIPTFNNNSVIAYRLE